MIKYLLLLTLSVSCATSVKNCPQVAEFDEKQLDTVWATGCTVGQFDLARSAGVLDRPITDQQVKEVSQHCYDILEEIKQVNKQE